MSHTSSFRRTIQRRIDNRTCTRQEWHAYRRWLSWSRRYGIEMPDYYFLVPVISAEWYRASRRMLRAFEPYMKAVEKASARSHVER
jgi:hypothetical protein